MRFLACTTIALTAACGSVNNTLPDAPPGDDTPDAANQPDARTTGTITVNVLTGDGDIDSGGNSLPYGLPRQGAQVFFIEPDGTTHLVVSGGDGVARSPDVHAGTTVLVQRPQSATQTAIETFFALSPGDTVTAGPTADTYVSTSSIGTMTVTTPAVSGATGYYIYVGCAYGSGSTPTITLTIYDPCDRTDRTMVALAYDASGLRGFSTKQVDLAPGTSTTMPAYQIPPSFVLNLSNMPAAADNAYVYGSYYDAEANIGNFNMSGDITGGSAVLQGPAVVAGSELLLEAYFYNTTGGNQNRFVRRVAGTPTTAAIDGTAMLPFTTYPQWDATTRAVTWDESGPTTVADVMVARGNYYLNGPGMSVSFVFVGPHVGHSFALPELPTELANLLPGASDSGYVYQLLLIDDVGKADYTSIVPTADADSRNYDYRSTDDVWISGGNLD